MPRKSSMKAAAKAYETDSESAEEGPEMGYDVDHENANEGDSIEEVFASECSVCGKDDVQHKVRIPKDGKQVMEFDKCAGNQACINWAAKECLVKQAPDYKENWLCSACDDHRWTSGLDLRVRIWFAFLLVRCTRLLLFVMWDARRCVLNMTSPLRPWTSLSSYFQRKVRPLHRA